MPESSYDPSFKAFILKYGIIAAAAGITIGLTTATFFKSFVADLILPVLFMLFVRGAGTVSSGAGKFFAQFLSNKGFRFTNFVSELITWILIILVSWFIVNMVNKYVMRNSHFKEGVNPLFKVFQETTPETFLQQQQMKDAWAKQETEEYTNKATEEETREDFGLFKKESFGMYEKKAAKEPFVEANSATREHAPF